jgi:hypothetical protein
MMGEKRRMPEIAVGLLGDQGDGEDGSIEEREAGAESDSNDEEHEGLHAAMSDFADAHAAGDHAGMAKAMSDFLDIHKHTGAAQERKPKRGPMGDEED